MLRSRSAVLATIGCSTLVLCGCASASAPDASRVAAAFENPATAPRARCELLAPATLAALEADESAACVDAIGQLALPGGAVRGTEVWGSGAQVRLVGDTVFLTETDAGWKVTAADCRARRDAPYECQVDGP